MCLWHRNITAAAVQTKFKYAERRNHFSLIGCIKNYVHTWHQLYQHVAFMQVSRYACDRHKNDGAAPSCAGNTLAARQLQLNTRSSVLSQARNALVHADTILTRKQTLIESSMFTLTQTRRGSKYIVYP